MSKEENSQDAATRVRNAVISTDKCEKKNSIQREQLKRDYHKDPLDEKMERSISSLTYLHTY